MDASARRIGHRSPWPIASIVLMALAACSAACGGADVHERPRAPRCPPPPEPAHEAVVVGTIGKMHMVESRYALSRLGDVFAAFKPDLVLVAVRVDAFRQEQLEDASFEMTYAQHLAKSRGVPVEPIDWFRESDLGAPPPAVEPFDVAEIEKRETELLRAPRLYTFEQANGAELGEKILLAAGAAARHRAGDPLATRRRAWIQHLAADAVNRHGKPKRVLAYVDVLERPAVDLVLRGVGYDGKTPVDVLADAKEVLAGGDIPTEVLATYRTQLTRAKERAEKATGPEKLFWEDRARVLDVVVDKKATCCVTQSMLAAK
jgi:hypothetical protein